MNHAASRAHPRHISDRQRMCGRTTAWLSLVGSEWALAAVGRAGDPTRTHTCMIYVYVSAALATAISRVPAAGACPDAWLARSNGCREVTWSSTSPTVRATTYRLPGPTVMLDGKAKLGTDYMFM